MLIQNRTDIAVPAQYTRQFEIPDGLAVGALARPIKGKIGKDWSFLELTKADLTGANLAGADLTEAKLTKAHLSWAYLAGAILHKAILTEAKLHKADLTWAILAEAYLYRADLTGANLTGADLTGAKLAGADLAGAKLAGAKFLAAATHERILKINFENSKGWAIAAFASYCGTQDRLAIGCECRLISEWETLPDEVIAEMHEDALPFWRENKAVLIRLAREKIEEFRKSKIT